MPGRRCSVAQARSGRRRPARGRSAGAGRGRPCGCVSRRLTGSPHSAAQVTACAAETTWMERSPAFLPTAGFVSSSHCPRLQGHGERRCHWQAHRPLRGVAFSRRWPLAVGQVRVIVNRDPIRACAANASVTILQAESICAVCPVRLLATSAVDDLRSAPSALVTLPSVGICCSGVDGGHCTSSPATAFSAAFHLHRLCQLTF